MGICAHPPVTGWSQRGDLLSQPTCFPEQLLRFVAPHPLLEQPQVFGIVSSPVNWNLVGAPKSFDLLTVDLLRTSPAFRGPEDDERPGRCFHFVAVGTAPPRLLLNRADIRYHLIENRGHALVHCLRLRSIDHDRFIPV